MSQTKKYKKYSLDFILVCLTVVVLFGILMGRTDFAGHQHYLQSTFWLTWLLRHLAALALTTGTILLGYFYKKANRWFQAGLTLILATYFWLFCTFIETILINAKAPVGFFRPGMAMTISFGVTLMLTPYLMSALSALSRQQQDYSMLVVSAIFVVAYFFVGIDALGFDSGATIIWFAYLLTLGFWLQQKFTKLPHGWLFDAGVLFVILLSAVAAWVNNNVITYDPHHGLHTTQHYLQTISPAQPLTVLAGAMLVLWLVNHINKRSNISLMALVTFGMGIAIYSRPKLLRSILFAADQKSFWFSVVVALVLATVLVVVIALVTRLANGLMGWLEKRTCAYRRSEKPLALLKRLTIQAWRWWLMALITWLLTVIGMAYLWDWNPNMAQWIVVNRELIIGVNILIVMALMLIVNALINRFWYSFAIVTVFYGGWIIASCLKVASRAEPILPSDMSMITSAKELLGMVAPGTIIATVVGILVLAGLAFVVQRRDGQAPTYSIKQRLIALVLALLYLSGFLFANHKYSPSKLALTALNDRPYFFSQLRGARLNGTLLQFANNVDVTIMDQPKGYSKAEMEKVAARYAKEAKQINQTRQVSDLSDQTLIFNLSESFADPVRVPNLKVSGNPIPYIRSMKQKTSSGLMISSGYGGGTAQMEYQSLTGLAISNFSPTLPTPYSQLVPFQNHPVAFTNFFDYRVGIHPFTANLYSRKKVYEKFNFNKFYHLDGGNKLTYTQKIDHNKHISDQAAYEETLLVMKQRPKAGQFINLVTMQNHMPYDNYYKKNNYSVSGTAYSDKEHKNSIETYIQGLHYTDDAMKQMIEKIDQVKRPVTILFYGDHLAGLYNRDSMSKYGLALHETDYFIYSNKASQSHDRQLSKTKIVSPSNFPAMALEKIDAKVSPYYALLTNVYHDLPVMTPDPYEKVSNNTAVNETAFIDQNGKVVKHLTKKQKQLLRDYELVQYDLTAGKNYLNKKSFTKDLPK